LCLLHQHHNDKHHRNYEQNDGNDQTRDIHQNIPPSMTADIILPFWTGQSKQNLFEGHTADKPQRPMARIGHPFA
ncbi:MAG TPA: hypothetical protein VN366_01085, partial [Feifaniaceae bacterium]|nr:hypothetical protein [Feifaniaceae bacterium]